MFTKIFHPFTPQVKKDRIINDIPCKGLKFDGVRKQALEIGRNRLIVTGVLFTLAFMIIGGRLVELSLQKNDDNRWSLI